MEFFRRRCKSSFAGGTVSFRHSKCVYSLLIDCIKRASPHYYNIFARRRLCVWVGVRGNVCLLLFRHHLSRQLTFRAFVFLPFPLCRSIGLTRAELLQYIDDPWWSAVRRYFFISFWIVLLAMFVAACIITMMHTQQHCDVDKSMFHPNSSSPANSTNDSMPIHDLISSSRKYP